MKIQNLLTEGEKRNISFDDDDREVNVETTSGFLLFLFLGRETTSGLVEDDWLYERNGKCF